MRTLHPPSSVTRLLLLGLAACAPLACSDFSYPDDPSASGGSAGGNQHGAAGSSNGDSGSSNQSGESGAAGHPGGEGGAGPAVEGGSGGSGDEQSAGTTASGAAGATAGGALGEGSAGMPAAGSPPLDPNFHLKVEAESGTLHSTAALGTSSEASAGKFVDLRATGRVDIRVSVESAAEYSLSLSTLVPGAWGSKVNDLYVNEERVGSFTTPDQGDSARFHHEVVSWVPLREGQNTISIRAAWGWIRVDYLELTAVNDEFKDVEAGLINPNASASARRLMQYLVDQYGSAIIAGQQGLDAAATVHEITGKEPALISFDFIEYSPSRVARGSRSSAADDAIGWWQERHGIVSVMWHWNAPSGLYDDADREWWRGFYTEATTFDLSAAMNDPASAEYGELVRDIDAIAEKLQTLEDADVPVLFRPLHEASGGWFWWGARGPAAYLQLWDLLYDRLTEFHGLDNLIWVWNGQAREWYPGDARVDIVSEDIYDQPRSYAPQSAAFAHATTYSVKPKLVALSENGALLDPDLLADSNANWSWFCVWSGQDFIGNETWNENSMLQKVYQHPLVITLDELPDLAGYPLP